ncbi:MAG: F0F1 ATP synthase subunit delta [Luteolibacter sp.]
MKVSKSAAITARRLFLMCHQAGRLDEALLRNTTQRIVDDKPREFRQILAALQRLVRVELERRKVLVESATELDAATRQRVASGLTTRYGDDLVFNYQTNPDLIGGLRIRVGDDVLDGTVKGRIDRLASAF